LNRIGNLLVPNDNYCKFENWIMPIFLPDVTRAIQGGTITFFFWLKPSSLQQGV
jgi:deoxyhypusine synthase